MLAAITVPIGLALCITFILIPVGFEIMLFGCYPMTQLIQNRKREAGVERTKKQYGIKDTDPWEDAYSN